MQAAVLAETSVARCGKLASIGEINVIQTDAAVASAHLAVIRIVAKSSQFKV